MVFQYDPVTKHCSFFNGKIEYMQGNVKTKCQSNTHFLSLQQVHYKPVLPIQSYVLAFSFQISMAKHSSKNARVSVKVSGLCTMTMHCPIQPLLK